MENQNISLVLSTDTKPRLKWTPQLHQRFVDAVNQLGGADKATPKRLIRLMGIPGLTLYHLKSHLQKYRLGKDQLQPENFSDHKQQDYKEIHGIGHDGNCIDEGSQIQMNENLEIAEALQLQMEVQSKLHEQIEVQRHLQLRIEAQGKYLKTVLKKAQETLAGYNSCSFSVGSVQLAKAELSQFVSLVNSGCPSSSFSELTSEIGGVSSPKELERKQMRGTMCSRESSLTSSESSGRKEEKQAMNYNIDPQKLYTSSVEVELSLMGFNPEYKYLNNVTNNPTTTGMKRYGSAFSDGDCVEQPVPKRSTIIHRDKNNNNLRKSAHVEMFDLNT